MMDYLSNERRLAVTKVKFEIFIELITSMRGIELYEVIMIKKKTNHKINLNTCYFRQNKR